MGIHGKSKKYLILRHGSCFYTQDKVQESGLSMTPVVIFDITWVTKYMGSCSSGEEFVQRQIINAFHPYFENGCRLVILAFDRYAPINKSAEHHKRYGHIVPEPLPVDTEGILAIVGPQIQIQNDNNQTMGSISTTTTTTFVAYSEESIRRNNLTNKQIPKYPSSYTINDIQKEESTKYALLKQTLQKRFDSADPAACLVMTDYVIPRPNKWDSVMRNQQLKKEIMHYITCKLVCDPLNPDTYSSGVYKKAPIHSKSAVQRPLVAGYTPKEGRIFCLHGGQSLKPSRDKELNKSLQSDDFLITISAQVDGSDQLGGLASFRREVSNADHHHPREIVGNLGEGEIACMYYSMQHRGEDQLIVTGDGDVLFIALLASRYRLVDDMQNFRNRVFVLLRIPNKTTKYTQRVTQINKQTEAAESLYVDVNKLHHEVVYKGDFSHCTDPVATQIGLLSLMKNDFIQGFASGLTGGVEASSQIPWLVLPMTKENKYKYKDMIKIQNPSTVLPGTAKPHLEARQSASMFNCNTDNNNNNAYSHFLLNQMLEETMVLPEVLIDEALFVTYVRECYYWKYKAVKKVIHMVEMRKKKIQNEERVQLSTSQLMDLYIDVIETHLSGFKKQSDHMMTESTIRAYARRLKWVLTYWSSAYLGKCVFPNPCETYKGQSVYGWRRSSDNFVSCETTSDISPEKPRGTNAFVRSDQTTTTGIINENSNNNNNNNDDNGGGGGGGGGDKKNNNSTSNEKNNAHRPWINLEALYFTQQLEKNNDSINFSKRNSTKQQQCPPKKTQGGGGIEHSTKRKRSNPRARVDNNNNNTHTQPTTPTLTPTTVVRTPNKRRKQNNSVDVIKI